ncbi:STE20-related kinase adapter protein beta [Callorhinchus milii]|uniref:STE20-related kinase adapter protein beta n=1 Tax=Callorhinchus milii TaxID=7868 RepID=K4FYN0_CALMI|nr:STE20-related kinase adapter protein beta [Callorhinchus milii]AFK11487.1 STE20-related kinase adapter protein beta [Callorhinchus milii]
MSFLDCYCLSRTTIESIDNVGQPDHLHLSDEFSTYAVRDAEMIYTASASHYELLSELGKTFCNRTRMTLARHIPSGNMVVVKQTNMDICSEENLSLLQNELLFWRLFRHPNILPHRAVFTEGSELWVITPFTAYGSARGLLKSYFTEGMNESLISHILYGVIKALNYIHQMRCIHRSVRPSNILISGDGHVYLSGLHGLCSMVTEGRRSKFVHNFPEFSASILPWLSPEVLQQDLHGYDVKSDIYSLGITACELARGQVPFQGMRLTQMLLQKLKGSLCMLDLTFPPRELRMKNSCSGMDSGIDESVATSSMMRTNTSEQSQSAMCRNLSANFHNFVEQCLQRHPENRPTARALLNHSFFKQVKKQTRAMLLNLLLPAMPLSSARATAETSQQNGNAPISPMQELDDDWDF